MDGNCDDYDIEYSIGFLGNRACVVMTKKGAWRWNVGKRGHADVS